MLESQKAVFSDDRFSELCDIAKKYGVSHRWYKELTVSEIKYIIDNTPLSENQRKGAIMHYVNKVKGKDIAIYFKYSDSGIKYQKKIVSLKMRETCMRVFK